MNSFLKQRHYFSWFFALMLLPGCEREPELKHGIWRGIFWVDDEQVPVNFEIGKKGSGTVFTVLEGDRRDTFRLERVGKDSLHISPETFDYRLFAKILPDGSLTGEYRHLAPGNTSRVLRFEAKNGEEYRFVKPGTEIRPVLNLSGTWSFSIAEREGDAANRVAVFSQDKNELKGIVLAITGDTGDLEGNISGDRFWLSGFSGTGVTLVQGRVDSTGRLKGTIGFGSRALNFTGVRDENAAIADAYGLTHLKPGFSKLELRLPNLNGDTVSLSDDRYKGKVVVIDILGSWCPNCIDQIEFLNPWYEQNKERGVEIIGVGFEVKDDLGYARKTLGKLVDKYGIRYEMLFGGKPDSENVQSKFEALNTFLAFPTTIIIGRDGAVKAIHTGFAGRGTGRFYQEFVENWNREMDKWL